MSYGTRRHGFGDDPKRFSIVPDSVRRSGRGRHLAGFELQSGGTWVYRKLLFALALHPGGSGAPTAG